MARFSLLLPVLAWFMYAADAASRVGVSSAGAMPPVVERFGVVTGVGTGIGGSRLTTSATFSATWMWAALGAVVLGMAVWGLRASRGGGAAAGRFLRAHRVVIVVSGGVWAGGLFFWGWGDSVLRIEQSGWRPIVPLELPGMLLAVSPLLGTWLGLWAARYPVDVAGRERSIWARLDAGLPVRPPPTLRRYLAGRLRVQWGVTLLPVLAVLATRDVAVTIGTFAGGSAGPPPWLDAVATAGGLVLTFVLAPVGLRRVLPTRPLPASPLRDRLEAFARRHGFRCRDILLWETDGTIANAAVMGVLPRVRYVLLSDLLVETMADRQIEAVFAHEVGHVRHRHMLWYAAAAGAAVLLIGGPVGEAVTRAVRQGVVGLAQHWGMSGPPTVSWVDPTLGVLTLAIVLTVFGALSRRFERQADVFAARTVTPTPTPAPARRLPPVSPLGAELFGSALGRVAGVNGIPLGPATADFIGDFFDDVTRPGAGVGRLRRRARRIAELSANHLHGTLADRILYVRGLAEHPSRTRRFDGTMVSIRVGILFAIAVGVLLLAKT